MQQISPVNATVIAFGPQSAVNKVRSVFLKMLKEDRFDLSKQELEACAKDIDSEAALKAIEEQRLDSSQPLPKAGGKKVGLQITLPEMTERFLTTELLDMPFAKATTCLMSWQSPNDQLLHQALWTTGGMQQSERDLD